MFKYSTFRKLLDALHTTNTALASYNALSSCISFLESKKSIYIKKIREDPFNSNAIEKLEKNNSWDFRFRNLKEEKHGRVRVTDDYKSIIEVNLELNGIKRDVTLCHELIHLYYGSQHGTLPSLFENKPNRLNHLSKTKGLEEEIVTEWLSRRIRATPKYLSMILDMFSTEEHMLESHIYDKSSLLASERRQTGHKYFGFVYEQYRKLYPKIDMNP